MLKLDEVGAHGEIRMGLLRTPYNLTVIKKGEAQTSHMEQRFRQYLDVSRFRHISVTMKNMFGILINKKGSKIHKSLTEVFFLCGDNKW